MPFRWTKHNRPGNSRVNAKRVNLCPNRLLSGSSFVPTLSIGVHPNDIYLAIIKRNMFKKSNRSSHQYFAFGHLMCVAKSFINHTEHILKTNFAPWTLENITVYPYNISMWLSLIRLYQRYGTHQTVYLTSWVRRKFTGKTSCALWRNLEAWMIEMKGEWPRRDILKSNIFSLSVKYLGSPRLGCWVWSFNFPVTVLFVFIFLLGSEMRLIYVVIYDRHILLFVHNF